MAKMGFGEVGNPADVDMVESTLVMLIVIKCCDELSNESVCRDSCFAIGRFA
jgi:hypothetical protein